MVKLRDSKIRTIVRSAISVLQSGGCLSMNCPFQVNDVDEDMGFLQTASCVRLLNFNALKVWAATEQSSTMSIFVENKTFKGQNRVGKPTQNAQDVLMQKVPEFFQTKLNLTATIEPYNVLNHSTKWFKQKNPNPPYIVSIMKP